MGLVSRDIIAARAESVSGGREGALRPALVRFEGAAVQASVGSAQPQIFVGKVQTSRTGRPPTAIFIF